MAAYSAQRAPDRCPTHPGELLREDVIPATGRTKTEIAALLGISRQHLYDILEERKPVSPAVAVRLGKLFGDGAGIWVADAGSLRHMASRAERGRQRHTHHHESSGRLSGARRP